MGEIVCAILGDRGVLRVDGPDARDFLQGLVSNDLLRLAPDRAIYAALLTPQGKYLFDFLLADDGAGAILLDAELARLAELRQRLLMYRLRSKVAVDEPGEGLATLAVFGPEAPRRLGLAAEPGAAATRDGAVLLVDPRLAELGVRVLLAVGAVDGFIAAHGLRPVPAEDYDLHRMRLGVPDSGRDLVPQKSILLESGFEDLNGVSFDKGCFVGQELTARTKYRGLVKRRLLPVRVEGPLPPPGTPVTAGGADAGEMRSGVGDRGMALLRVEPALAALGDGQELRAGQARLAIELPAWVRLPVRAAPV